MPLTKQVILTENAPKPLSVLNQGLVVGDMVNPGSGVGETLYWLMRSRYTALDKSEPILLPAKWSRVLLQTEQ